tara:strand:+ start:30333 stop:31478 length:1146 start_codon:yes stop_codon:yes gene_type:complete
MQQRKNLEISCVKSVTEIPKSTWNMLSKNNILTDYDFFHALEISQCTSDKTGWIPNHIVFKLDKIVVAIIPTFKKLNSFGEYVFDHSWADAYHRMGINYYPKLLTAIPFTPINTDKILINKIYVERFDEIITKLREYLLSYNLSSYHINFINLKDSDKLKNFNFFQRTGIQYHWKNNHYSNFNDFLSEFRSKKKKNIVKERNYLIKNKIKISQLIGDEISKDDLNFFYKCYSNTIEKKWSQKYLNLNFFENILKSNLKKKILLITAKDNDENYLACSLNFIDKDKLIGRYWGCQNEIPFLHFELCYYQTIDFCIKNNINLIEAGAQGEHKIARGYRPTLTFSNHWVNNKVMEEPIANFLSHENKVIKRNLSFLNNYLPFKK